jgi:hypothetical protein
MEFIHSKAEVKLPEVTVTQSNFWVPFHIVNGPGEIRELKEAAEYADIVD